MPYEDDYKYTDDSYVDLNMDESWLLYDSFEDSDNDSDENIADTPADALVKCVNRFGRVNLRWIVDSTELDIDDVVKELKGLIYQNPATWREDMYEGWELADEYLSGDLRKKLIKARAANHNYPGVFEDNIEALKHEIPIPLEDEELFVTVGTPLPPDIIDDFINEAYMLPPYLRFHNTRYDEVTGSWEIPGKWRFTENVTNTIKYGTQRISGIEILERRLNMRTVKVTDEVVSKTTKSGYTRKVNEEETAAAQEKLEIQIQDFKTWIWADKKRADRVRKHITEKFSYRVTRSFDGSLFRFPGLSESVNVFSYVKDYAATIVMRKGCMLLALETGAGKTYIMILAVMELVRLGIARKCMIVVPNDLVEQWRETFLMLYKDANVLCVGPDEFKGEKKYKVLEDIRDNDSYDGIIIAYSCFDSIPLSRKHYVEELTAEKERLLAVKRRKTVVTSALNRKIEHISKKLGEAAVSPDASKEIICFDELGIDRLFVDEAHNYKNVSIETSLQVLGVKQKGSKKCDDMMQKVHHIQKKNNGGGVVFASATPITNSVADLYVMQRYLQGGELDMLELSTFDSWVGSFAEQDTNFEIAPDTNTFRFATRLSKYHNIPELTTLFSSVALFRMKEEISDLPERKYKEILIPKPQALNDFFEEISVRADKVYKHLVTRKEDNMLKITVDGRKAALDPRLVINDLKNVGITKISVCAENAAITYFRTSNQRSTQLIFCDMSTPSYTTRKTISTESEFEAFNVYEALKKELVFFGVKSEEIAFIHDANTPAKREKLFKKVREGVIRVLIGSTFKLGTGVNVQDKIIAIHHLDVPWKPSEMVQREGRAIRTGNENSKVEIYRYITEGSFDAYSWQILDTKQKFITDLLSGTGTARSGNEVDDTVLNYAEIKALAIGNPDLKKRVEIQNEISRLMVLRKKDKENRLRAEKRKAELPALIRNTQLEYLTCRYDARYVRRSQQKEVKKRSDEEMEQRRKMRELLANAVRNNVMCRDERTLMQYRGFFIVLPAGMVENHPYVMLVHKGKYRVDVSDKEKGVLVRIDNYIDKLDDRGDMFRNKLDLLRREQIDINKELDNVTDYDSLIEAKKSELSVVDERLGIKHE